MADLAEPVDGETITAFRMAMRRFAAAVSVISGTHDGLRCGISATAVCSVSMAPPAMLACINRGASVHAALRIGAPFCINILDARDREVSAAFGGMVACEDKFAFGAWSEDQGTPYLAGARANIFCAVDQLTRYGTHDIVIGRVERVMLGGDGAPLLYHDGGYL